MQITEVLLVSDGPQFVVGIFNIWQALADLG